MNKRMVVSAILALSLTVSSSAVYAKAGNNGKAAEKAQNGKSSQVTVTVEEGGDATVTDSVYGDGKGQGGAHGLLNAYGNVQGKPAGERIAAKLKEKYGIDVTADAAFDPAALVTELESDGRVAAAADVQAEAVLAFPADLEGYKQLGRLKKKLGHKGIATYVNGEAQQYEEQPVVRNGRTLVPFRAVSSSLKADVQWDAASKTVTVKRGDVEIKLVLGSRVALVNGKETALDVPAAMKNNRVFVPMRFLSEALDAEVVYQAESQSVIVLDESIAAAGTEAADEA